MIRRGREGDLACGRVCTYAACSVVALVALSASLAFAHVGQPTQPVLTPVEQGVEDRDGLSTSYRDMGVDLRAPTNFDRVYRVDPRSRMLPGAMRGSTQFARAQGGLVAVYPQGAYRDVARGVQQVQVPPGTVFLLQDSAKLAAQPRGWTAAGNAALPKPPASLNAQRIEPERTGTRIDTKIVPLPGAVDATKTELRGDGSEQAGAGEREHDDVSRDNESSEAARRETLWTSEAARARGVVNALDRAWKASMAAHSE